jgi:hypothetical protein
MARGDLRAQFLNLSFDYCWITGLMRLLALLAKYAIRQPVVVPDTC